jgi:hypothetical protein
MGYAQIPSEDEDLAHNIIGAVTSNAVPRRT